MVTLGCGIGCGGSVRTAKRLKSGNGDRGPFAPAKNEQHGIHISRETLRHWLIEAKLWRPRRARVERAHVWRARRARYGELVQWDTSEHNWLEGRGEKLYLIAMIDGAGCVLLHDM